MNPFLWYWHLWALWQVFIGIAVYGALSLSALAFASYMHARIQPTVFIAGSRNNGYGDRIPSRMAYTKRQNSERDFWKVWMDGFCVFWPVMIVACIAFLIGHDCIYLPAKAMRDYVHDQQERAAIRAQEARLLAEHDALSERDRLAQEEDREDSEVKPLTGDERAKLEFIADHLGIKPAIEAPKKKTVVAPDEILVPKSMGRNDLRQQGRKYNPVQ